MYVRDVTIEGQGMPLKELDGGEMFVELSEEGFYIKVGLCNIMYLFTNQYDCISVLDGKLQPMCGDTIVYHVNRADISS